MALAGSLVLFVTATLLGLTGEPQGPLEPPLLRLKPADPEMRRLIVDGYQRSETFRALTDAINQSNAIVIVQYGLCSLGRFRSCVSDVQADERQRHIRIKIDSRTTGDRLTATIAHELAHATEILNDPMVTSSAATLDMYRRIGTAPCRRKITNDCETQHALDVEKQVLGELDRAARR
jgi:hypothetical protein